MRRGLVGSTAREGLSASSVLPSRETICCGAVQVLPASVEKEMEGPMMKSKPSGVVVLRMETYWKLVGLLQVTTGSPISALAEKVPGVRKPRSVKFLPEFAE